MREILFRGKTLTGMWVEGAYYKQEEFYGEKEDAHIIITSKETLYNDFALESHIVIPETVGQYTGLTDKNDKKIFEGDILKVKSYDYDYEYLTKVFYNSNTFCVDVYGQDYDYTSIGFAYDIWDDENCEIEVIGNIHDNPELLKGDKLF